MSDPSKLSRDVKGLVADFREELKLRDPWDREIDIQFKRIQRKYKEILFDFAFARQAHSVDQALWTDTSYALITRYRARIDPTRSSPANNKNVVENRKILQKFLAFLAAEGAFWSGIASRLVRVHGLTEANKAMTALGMNIVEFENRESLARRGAVGTSSTASDDFVPPTHPPPTPEHRSNKLLTVFRALIYLGDLARYREQYGTHPNKSNLDGGGRRSRGGRRGRGGGGDKTQEKPYAKAEAFYTQARLLLPDYGNPFNQLAIVYAYQHDFFGAALYYYRALCVRKPFPTAQDNLVRTLGKCLEVDRELWRVRRAEEGNDGPNEGMGAAEDTGKGKAKAQSNGKSGVDNDGSRDLESKFKQDVVLLHALWIGKCRLPKLARHTHNVLASFASLLTRRLLPTATIVQVLVMALGALWKVRMFRADDNPRRTSSKVKGRDREDPEEETPLETRITAHLLALCTVLLDIATREIQEGVREVGNIQGPTLEDERQLAEKLAQRITGTFRRTLPALRIANKWIKGSVRYIQQYPLENASEHSVGHDPTSSPSLPSTMRPSLTSFWLAWARFETRLTEAFPLDVLPPLTVRLEEDIDMKGFSPLKWGTAGVGPGNPDERHPGGTTEAAVDVADVHPNEEQLMRIGDLLVDAKYIANLPECPVSVVGQEFVLDVWGLNQARGDENAGQAYEEWEEGGDHASDEEPGSDRAEEMPEEEDDELPHPDDDRATVSTRTEDDPVHLAMNAVLTEDEDDDEEEILYPQSHRHVTVSMSPPPDSTSPLVGPGAGPAWPPPTPSFLSGPADNAAIRPNQTPLPKRAGTTAEDLLNRVLGGTPSFVNMPSVSTSDTSSLITSATPFGGNTISVHGPTPSFLAPSTQGSIPSPLPAQNLPFNAPGPAFGIQSRQTMALSPPLPSQVSPFSSRPSSFSSSGTPNPVGQPFPSTSAFPGGRPTDPSAAFFPTHTRVSSLTGAASIWTPAPQEVSKSPQLGMPSRTGPMRANSISGTMLPPSTKSPPGGLPTIAQGSEGDVRAWHMRNQGFGEMQPTHGFRTMPRQRTYTTPAEMPHWG